MPRPTRSDVSDLMQEAHAIEILAGEAEFPPDRVQEYWTVAADLVVLVAEIEEYAASHPRASADEPAMVSLRRRLRTIAATLTELAAL